MALYAELSKDFKKIYIIDDVAAPADDRLDVYLGGELLGYFLKVPTPQSFTKTLAFPQLTTTYGPAWVFEIDPIDIGQTGTEFTSGVYHFTLNSADGLNPKTPFGVINDKDILCCMATKLQSGDSTCGLTIVKSVNEINALMVSADANLRLGRPDTANCLYDLASYECADCCA